MDKYKRWLRNLPLLIGVVFTLLIAGGVYFLQDLFKKPAQPKKQMQQITMVQMPPPPPPPPPEQKPPEPEPEPEKIPEPEPEPEPEPTPEQAPEPAGEELGVDAEGGAGGDAFGLLGKKGGRGLLGSGGGSAILWYGGQVKRGLEDELQRLLPEAARKSAYAIELKVWVNADGGVNRAELAGASGKPDIDQAIRSALPNLQFTLPKPPPENMPQPLRVRVTSRI